MGDPVSSRQYFLGIGGQQSGPFSETEILQQWRSGQLPQDALLWYDGLEDWTPADILLKSIVGAAPAIALTPLGNYVRRQSDEVFSTFASKEEGLNPVFEDGDAGGSASFFLRFRLHFFLGTVILAGFIVAGGFYIYTWVNGPKVLPESAPVAGKKLDRRDLEYRKAVSDILLNSDQAIASFTKLIKENPSDEIGKQALESAIDFYRRSQRYQEIGRMLLVAKQPAEAVKYFLGDQPSYPEALSALETAFSESPRSEFLLQQIELLLGPINEVSQAVDRIKKFELAFPKSPHPFGYYLKTPDEQVADLFSRISFYFVQSLMNFLESELPQVHLVKRPMVELKRDKDGGYRIVGSYSGDVTFSRDPLKGIQLVFWLSEDRWVMVETNLTKERSKWAAGEKEKLKKNILTRSQILSSLEQRFRTQFPKSQLHEVAKPADVGAKTRSEE